MDWSGVGHGPESHMEMTLLFTVRNQLILEQEFFWDHAEALRAAGVRE